MSTATQQPDPLQLAQLLESFQEAAASAEQRAAAALRRLHAENQQLRADLEAVGAGGVGPLIPTTVQHQIKLSRNNDLQRESGHSSTSSSTAPQPLTDEQIVSMANPTQYLPEAPEGWVRFGFSRKHLVGFARAVLDAAQQPPVVEQPQIDWHDMYLKERRRAEMWIAKYEQDIGKLEVAVPVAARPPSVAARTCANCLHNKPPFGNCDGCSQQNDDADDEGNWEPIPEPQGEQEPALVVAYDKQGWGQMLDDMREIPDGTPLYTHPQPKREDVLLEVIQRLNQNPYSLTKSECIDLIKAMRTNGIGGEA